jgi:hypothetical protein
MTDLNYIDRTLEVKIAGQDASGNGVNYVSADVNGNILTRDYSDGPVVPGTAASVSALIGGQFNTVLPTLSNTQQSAIQVDNSGRIIVRNSEFPSTVDTNYGTAGASTLRTASQIGNATGAANFNAGLTGAQTLRVVSNINDGFANAITSTLINSKQRLDACLSSEAQDGAALPFSLIAVGGETPTTTLEPIQVDSFGNVVIVGNIDSGVSDSGSPVKTGAVFNTTLPTVTNGQRVNSQADSNGRLIVTNTPLDGSKATYSASISELAIASAATDIFTITGSATKTIRIIKITISGTQTTRSYNDVVLLKRSTPNTSGTSTTRTAVRYDSSDAVATAVVQAYTANPTTGVLVGNFDTINMPFGIDTPTSPQSNGSLEVFSWNFGSGPLKAIVVRGINEVVAINFNGQTLPGSTLDVSVVWTEE